MGRTGPIGVRKATRLWFTVPPRLPRAVLPVPPRGRVAHVEVAGAALHATVWGAGPSVYLVHGWGGRSEQLGAMVTPLVDAGFRVVAFDAPAHGASGPGRYGGAISELAAALQAAVAGYGHPRAVIAHGTGATATAHAMRAGLRPSRLIMLAPVSDPGAMLDTFADQLMLSPRVRAGLRRAVRRRDRALAAPDMPGLAATIDVPPTMVVHDRDDHEIPFAQARAIAGAWPGARLVATDGLGHHRLLRDEAVLTEVVAFAGSVGATATDRRPS